LLLDPIESRRVPILTRADVLRKAIRLCRGECYGPADRNPVPGGEMVLR